MATVTLTVEFTNTEVGLSTLTATCDNAQSQTINHSGNIVFNNVIAGSSIDFDGTSNGNTKLSIIGVTLTDPMGPLNYDPGVVQGGFIIINE